MLYSLLVKLAMLVATIAAVSWITWGGPPIQEVDQNRGAEVVPHDVDPGPAVGTSQASTTASGVRAELPETPGAAVVKELDLNRATEHELESLPGVGPVLARRIVQYREAQGTFRDVYQLRDVKGIGQKTFDRIRVLVSVSSPPGAAATKRKAT